MGTVLIYRIIAVQSAIPEICYSISETDGHFAYTLLPRARIQHSHYAPYLIMKACVYIFFIFLRTSTNVRESYGKDVWISFTSVSKRKLNDFQIAEHFLIPVSHTVNMKNAYLCARSVTSFLNAGFRTGGQAIAVFAGKHRCIV